MSITIDKINNFSVWMKNSNYDIKTIKTYNSCLQRFLSSCGGTMTYGSIDDYTDTLNLAPRTINNHLAAIKLYIQWVSRREKIEIDSRLVRLVRVPDSKIFSLKEEVVKKLIATIEEKKSITDQRDALIVYILYECGLRVTELVNMKTADIDQDNSIEILGKGKKWRTVFLSPKVLGRIKKYQKNLASLMGEESEYVIASHSNNSKGKKLSRAAIESIIKKRTGKLGLCNVVTPHTLRHSFATNLMRKGVNIRHIQVLLGHKFITTTQQYLHYVKDEIASSQSHIFGIMEK